ncbi:unnamed protein product [Danaus chrysippus]|uniref:(African queen) hypothetical protein n=1 Tax=Danaus chrysippus TaxID=151541 RepID=A0A8J2QRS9_9NEOP|nr:unnamed protein product [Danaus chrysippus]
MSVERDAPECEPATGTGGDMQAVVCSGYLTQDLLLARGHAYTEYSYGDEDSLTTDEKITVDDKEDELVVDDEEGRGDVEDGGTEGGETSWHPHVYGKPPKKPTPHTIEYILGLTRSNEAREEKRSAVSQLINVKRNFDKKTFSQEKGVQVQEGGERKMSVHKNRLQEQLLQRGARGGEGGYDKHGKTDEPLNLSVNKAKESPTWTGDDEDKYGRGLY